MSECILELEGISKTYKDGNLDNLVLDNINLSINNNEFIAILGPSGSGKSTLLSIMGALLSSDTGTIKIKDTNLTNMTQKEWTHVRRSKIGFIFQNHFLLPFINVKQQLELVSDLNKDKVKQDIPMMLKELGLDKLSDKYPNKLSGGEKQRVAIARAFINDPDIILADEPTASLDSTRGRQIVEMIRDEVKRKNKCAVMVTHDERILDLVDKVYTLEDGKLKLSTTKEI